MEGNFDAGGHSSWRACVLGIFLNNRLLVRTPTYVLREGYSSIIKYIAVIALDAIKRKNKIRYNVIMTNTTIRVSCADRSFELLLTANNITLSYFMEHNIRIFFLQMFGLSRQRWVKKKNKMRFYGYKCVNFAKSLVFWRLARTKNNRWTR